MLLMMTVSQLVTFAIKTVAIILCIVQPAMFIVDFENKFTAEFKVYIKTYFMNLFGSKNNCMTSQHFT